MLKHISIVIVLSLSFASNCASFADTMEDSNISILNEKPNESGKLNVSIDYRIKGQEGIFPHTAIREAKLTKKIFEESNQFNQVNLTRSTNDLNVKIVRNSQDTNTGGAFLTGLTFGILPTYSNLDHTIAVEIKNSKTGISKTYARSFKSKFFVGWIFLPISPFFWPTSVSNNIQTFQLKSVLAEAKKEGIY
ncbi:hypothetical protein EHQ24_11880 [Leptospira noumeaensis]|uniref:Lipoprotein n=1 Tax=Leptospira noumeaensis TaxID=2484964 RepID=A0A4V3JJU5_9LEPT|nr:hypothetical protein [Leptospira noumeaensis]TGK81974.1 hypothetical protein EHQ24_11880 [Leptospira noumeaensis]